LHLHNQYKDFRVLQLHAILSYIMGKIN